MRTLLAEREFPAKPSPLCRWCEYRDGCSASPLRDTRVPSYERRPQLQTAARAATRAPARRRKRRAPRVHPGQLPLPLEEPAVAAV